MTTQTSQLYVRRNNFSDNAVKHTYITTPIFYVNAGPHIGHAYTAVLADTVARFNSMLGHSVFLCTGTDEHGVKVQKAANDANLPTPEYCTQISREFQEMCNTFQVSYSDFIRTTEERHRETVHYFWNRLEERGHIYKGKYSGWYSASEEAFVPNKEVLQKDSKTESSDKTFSESGHVLEWTEEDTYKFRLTSFKDDLKCWFQDENLIKPAIYRSQIISWLDDLEDLSISRPIQRVPWAISAPSDESHTVYVWLDALINYLTSVGYPDNSFKKFWPPTVQVIGKDILKFHSVYWPAFLMAAGLEPPKQLLCHGHWTVKDEKMSKSKGNVISPFTAAKDFTTDGFRYFLLREAVLHADANYSTLKVKRILNAELADTLGNLVNRCFGNGVNPERIIYNSIEYKTILRSEVALKNIQALEELGEKTKKHYEEYHLHHAVDAVMSTLRITNQMFDHHKPWYLKKSENLDSAKELESVISLCFETVRVVALILYPILPRLSSDLLDFFQIPQTNRTWEDTKPLHLTGIPIERTSALSKKLFFKKLKN
ncbi:Methionine--tRNA ligase, mitochondrial [Anthophora quadrimaculata]